MRIGVIFATALPNGISATDLSVLDTDLSVTKGVQKTFHILTTPATTTDTLAVTTTESNVTANVVDNNKITVLVDSAYTKTTLALKVTCGTVEKTVTLTVS